MFDRRNRNDSKIHLKKFYIKKKKKKKIKTAFDFIINKKTLNT